MASKGNANPDRSARVSARARLNRRRRNLRVLYAGRLSRGLRACDSEPVLCHRYAREATLDAGRGEGGTIRAREAGWIRAEPEKSEFQQAYAQARLWARGT